VNGCSPVNFVRNLSGIEKTSQNTNKKMMLVAGFAATCFKKKVLKPLVLLAIIKKWWRRRDLNPRPWQINQPRLHA